MALLGLVVGIAFPPFTALLGVPQEHVRTIPFITACAGAGLLLAAANWLLARRVIGRRLRSLVVRLEAVAAAADGAASSGGGAAPDADHLRLPVRSADDPGAAAAAFNALLEALDRERRFRSVVRASSDVIVLVDPAGRIVFVSDSALEVLGPGSTLVVGAAVRDAVHPADAGAVDALTTTSTPGLTPGPDASAAAAVVVRLPHTGGGWRHLEFAASDQREDPVVSALLLTGRDVTDRLQLQVQLEHQAGHDELTGLPNRASVLASGVELLARLRPGEPLAVLLMDLDRFKEVNDTLGHGYGDRLLAEIGPRLAPLVREVDVLARLGGDEFAVLLPGVDAEGARAVGLRLRAAVTEPFVVDDLSLDVDVSIGIATSGGPGPHDIHSLLRQADIAMYAAKEVQRGVELYDPATDVHDRSRLVLLSDFRRALAEDQLVVHYQPKVALDAAGGTGGAPPAGRVVGVEALVRWQHPGRGLLAPGDFLPAVERTGLVEELTAVVIDRALAQVRAWSEQGLHVPVAVNLSARSLHHLDLPDRVLEQLRVHGVPPAMLRLEITESALMADPERAQTVLTRLHAAGVGLSIDDFGTGYSSMVHLRRIPVDELKVDRGFVTDMTSRADDAVLVRAVIELGHDLGLTVVAEGVEEAATVTALTDLGCDAAQGYLFARPQSAEDVTAWLLAGAPAAVPAG